MAISLLALELCLAAREPQSLGRSLRWLLLAAIGLAAGFAYFALVRGLFDPEQLAFTPIGGEELWGVWPQFLTQSRAIAWYQLLLAFPLPAWSAIDHHLPLSRTLADQSAYLAVLLHAGWLLAAAVALLRRHSLAALGILWFYIPLSPYLVLPEADHLVEYKTYLPSVGILILTVAGLRVLHERIQGRRAISVVWCALALWVALLFAATLRTQATYQTTIAIWQDAVAAHPGNPRAVYHLGLALAQEGRGEEAMPHFKKAARLAPQWSGPAASIGFLLAERKQYDLALRWYKRAVAAESDDTSARLGIARVLLALDRPAAAIPHLEAALEDPGRREAEAYALLGRAQWRLGRPQAAEDALTRSHHLGLALEDSEFHFALGENALRAGLYEMGILELRRALALRPDWTEATNNLAWHLATAPATHRRPVEAVELAQLAAVQTDRRDLNVLDTLATALAAAGKHEAALRVVDEALGKVSHETDPQLAADLTQTRRAIRDSSASSGP
jgi:tetratricopeptide (TPR) repeat protein